MKKFRKCILYIISIIALLIATNLILFYSSVPNKDAINQAKAYAKKNGMRTDFIVLCDFSCHSGRPRFWVYDCKEDKIISRSLCAHGNGEGNRMWRVKVSNEVGSRCSSIGMFSIEGYHEMKGRYRSLKLKGLSKTNSRAEQRGILIHSGFTARHFRYGIFPFYIPLTNESEGCFAISESTLSLLINASREKKQKMLLYAYQ